MDRQRDGRARAHLDDEGERAAGVRIGGLGAVGRRRARLEGPLPRRHARAGLVAGAELDELSRAAILLTEDPNGTALRRAVIRDANEADPPRGTGEGPVTRESQQGRDDEGRGAQDDSRQMVA